MRGQRPSERISWSSFVPQLAYERRLAVVFRHCSAMCSLTVSRACMRLILRTAAAEPLQRAFLELGSRPWAFGLRFLRSTFLVSAVQDASQSPANAVARLLINGQRRWWIGSFLDYAENTLSPKAPD